MDLTSRWRALLDQDPSTLRLAEAAALVAAHRHPELDPDHALAQLDEIAASCPGTDLAALRTHLFGTMGFRGDVDDYHHERNSMLPVVLVRRRGLPILLSVVTIDVGRRLGLDLHAVGMPGHVLVGVGRTGTYLDPFAGGALVDADGAAALFHRTQGTGVAFDERLLAPTPPLDVVARILANLRSTYAAAADRANLRWVMELRLTLPSVDPAEAFDLAEVLARAGEVDRAADVLEDLVSVAGDGPAATEARRRSIALRAQLN